jgi:hypothetical protein
MKQLLECVYKVCSNISPGVKIGPTGGRGDGVIDFPYMYVVKTYKVFFLKTQIARA